MPEFRVLCVDCYKPFTVFRESQPVGFSVCGSCMVGLPATTAAKAEPKEAPTRARRPIPAEKLDKRLRGWGKWTTKKKR